MRAAQIQWAVLAEHSCGKLDYWEIGKCFLPPDGYSSVLCVQESDFNGVISIMLNCLHFQTCLSSACLSPPPPDNQCPLEKAIQYQSKGPSDRSRYTSHSPLEDFKC
ncbi:hypothetical protein DPMN_152830 [Dreissena polymorpha]|uniref:Uncharacterized protein n=1 Tax=Dreissena polymorpha TaxID=45954 RepID=A0A9D4FHI0_DREPO|nr:hypothetical protein DPMN_152830 [Dreissena polymorpha]